MGAHGLGNQRHGPGRVPVRLTKLFGRDADVGGLTDAVRQARLLTVVGAPGCGKTRLAVEVAGHTAGSWAGGVWFVDFAPLTDEPSVVPAVALALGLREQPQQAPVDTLVEMLGAAQVLLVLDNCEHVVEAVAALAERLVLACPGVHVLATSRVSLGVHGEQVWEATPLPADAAAALFVDRATLASNRFRADDATVAAICERLGRLPLAIELAAASTRLLSAGQILDRLAQALPLVRPGDRRPADPRHTTMTATVEWSLRLLPPKVQELFTHLSVFAGTFDLTAACAVATPTASATRLLTIPGATALAAEDVDDEGAAEVLAGLTTLVDHSLVEAEPAADGSMRYRLLEPVRQCVAGLLPAGPEGDRVRRRHAEHYLVQAYRYDPLGIHGVLRNFPLAVMELDEANLLVALQWARRTDLVLALRMGTAIAPFWEFGGRVNEGRAWMEDLLAADLADAPDVTDPAAAGNDGPEGVTGRARVRMQVQRAAARLAWRQKDHARARELLEACVDLARQVGNGPSESGALCTLGVVTFSDGQFDLSVEYCEQALARARDSSSDVATIWALVALGWAQVMRGEHKLGEAALQEALEANRPFGSPSVEAQAHGALVFGTFVAGDLAGTRENLAGMLAAMEAGGAAEQGDWLGMASGLAAAEGRARSAALLAGGTRAFQQRRGSPAPDAMVEPFLPVHSSGALVDRQEAEGERMTWDELVAEALREPGAAEPHPLTRREMEVATLVGEGLNNVAIAAELHISRRTVESHVENIKRKLALAHRHQILTWSLTHLPPR